MKKHKLRWVEAVASLRGSWFGNCPPGMAAWLAFRQTLGASCCPTSPLKLAECHRLYVGPQSPKQSKEGLEGWRVEVSKVGLFRHLSLTWRKTRGGPWFPGSMEPGLGWSLWLNCQGHFAAQSEREVHKRSGTGSWALPSLFLQQWADHSCPLIPFLISSPAWCVSLLPLRLSFPGQLSCCFCLFSPLC